MRAFLFILTSFGLLGLGVGQTYGWIRLERELSITHHDDHVVAQRTNAGLGSGNFNLAGSWQRPYFLSGSSVVCPWETPFAGSLFNTPQFFAYDKTEFLIPGETMQVYAVYSWKVGHEIWQFVPAPPNYEGETEHGEIPPPTEGHGNGPFRRDFEQTYDVVFYSRVVSP